MKKVLLAVMILMAVVSVKAQSEFTFGPKVGFNMTNVTNVDMKNKISFHIGGFAEYRVNEYWGIQPELIYSRQGARDKETSYGDENMKIKYRVNYLNIPVMFKLYVLENLSVDLGPQVGFALNGKYVAKDGGDKAKKKLKDLNTVDFSFGIGASYELDMGLILSARYNLGLTNIRDKNTNNGNNNKNHVFQLSAGWRIDNFF